ncbi:hypothetical protein [Myxococcus sp. AS-1-15]|uniref:hypothetical protein n=1 Tax=Myxococcus sp. AS-1-15 TaxID=2874600 RepID=UPI001CBD0DC6|nr:hypothetical protein [Myxococcus sp. AS-1-15]MBZ4402010.1 hypothetical protein [Myxococcus sp. AS-1-15]
MKPAPEELSLKDTLAAQGLSYRPTTPPSYAREIVLPDGTVALTAEAATVWAWLRVRNLSDVDLVRAMAKAARTYEHHEMSAVRAVAGERGVARIRAAVATISAEVDARDRAALAQELES